MNAQPFNYWNYISTSYQTSLSDLPPDVSDLPSLSGSPASITNDSFPAPIPQTYYPQIADEQLMFGSYATSISPTDFSSDDSPNCSPRPPPANPVFADTKNAAPTERPHATSGRRRAQNRAAQRAFRARKEQHARDLEVQLSAMTEKYNKLEASHSELNIAYEKLRRTVELLTADDTNSDSRKGQGSSQRSGNADTLRKMLDILHGDFRASMTVKQENEIDM